MSRLTMIYRIYEPIMHIAITAHRHYVSVVQDIHKIANVDLFFVSKDCFCPSSVLSMFVIVRHVEFEVTISAPA